MIRAATPSDTKAISVVHVTAWQHAYRGQLPEEFLSSLSLPDRERMWGESLERTDNDIYVYTSESEVVEGFVHFGASRDGDGITTSEGEVFAIYLLPDSIRRGTGRALLASAERELERRGYKQFVLWVLETNTPARAFYEAMSYRVDGAVKTLSLSGREFGQVRYRK